ncbi:putative nuclease [Nymphaea thermarum]|nr:putative nuclease [Nymphaea thermarum]
MFFRHRTQRRRIVHPFKNAGIQFVDNIINSHPRNCLDLMRMDRNSFITLCNMLKERNLVEDGRAISVEEQVAIFLLTVGHNERNRACQYMFQHSGQTISMYVNIIVQALCQLGMENIRRPNDETPSKIRLNPRYNPYFQDCLGALDGTHIPICVHTSEQPRFRNRKGTLSQNVLAVVGFDMRFHYVLAGWEGSATDSRVLYSALDNDVHPFVIPTGKYYLGDGGYLNIHGLLTPYRGHRYYLSEFNAPGARRVTCAEELFNHRHSSLRTTVERAFGLLKGWFHILKTQVSYPYRTQAAIVLATCVLHNFIIDHNPNAEHFHVDESAFDDANDNTLFENEVESATQSYHRRSNNDLRGSISSQMFIDFQNERCRLTYDTRKGMGSHNLKDLLTSFSSSTEFLAICSGDGRIKLSKAEAPVPIARTPTPAASNGKATSYVTLGSLAGTRIQINSRYDNDNPEIHISPE